MSLVAALDQCGQLAWFALRALPAALMAWRTPAELLRQLYSILLGALPLGLIAGLALGIVVCMACIAIAGSFLAEMAGGSLSMTQYHNDVMHGLEKARLVPATLKTIVFGYLVAMTGCYFGMQATEGTEAVGRAATRGVVYSI